MKTFRLQFYSIVAFCMIFLYIDPQHIGLGRQFQAIFTGIMMTSIFLYKSISFHIYRKFNFLAYLLTCSIIISSLLNKDLSLGDYELSSYTLGILYAIIFILFLHFVEYVVIIGKINILFNTFYKACLLTCLLIDVLILAIGQSAHAYYFIGDKFTISYLHIFAYGLFYYYQNNTSLKNKIIHYIILLLSFIISIKIECSTGLIGSLIIMLLLHKKRLFQRTIIKGNKMIFYVIIFTTLSFFFIELTKFSFIQYLIVDILNEDLTLTGRTRIYLILLDAITQKPWFGWGQDHGMWFLGYYYNTPNAQNGLFNYITDYGLIGGILFLILLNYLCRNVKNTNGYYILAIIFTFIILSSVEITFNLQFYAYLLLLIPFIHLRNKKKI